MEADIFWRHSNLFPLLVPFPHVDPLFSVRLLVCKLRADHTLLPHRYCTGQKRFFSQGCDHSKESTHVGRVTCAWRVRSQRSSIPVGLGGNASLP